MRFRNLYAKRKIKNNLNLWFKLKKEYFNSFYLNFFFKYFFIFNFNSYNSFNWNFFTKSFLNFFDVSLFKINNTSKKNFLSLLKKKTFYNSCGNFFFVNFTSFYSRFDFLNNISNLSFNNNLMFRFRPILLSLGNNFVQQHFFKKKNFTLFIGKDRFKIFIICLKFIFKYYFNFILVVIFNFLNMFFAFFNVFLWKCFLRFSCC